MFTKLEFIEISLYFEISFHPMWSEPFGLQCRLQLVMYIIQYKTSLNFDLIFSGYAVYNLLNYINFLLC